MPKPVTPPVSTDPTPRCERFHLAQWKANPAIVRENGRAWKDCWCELCGRMWRERWVGR